MLSASRQEKLDPLLTQLRNIPGITRAAQDDFDSLSVRVCLDLDDCNSCGGSIRGNKPYRFLRPIQEMKRAIRRCLADAGIDFRFSSWPVLKYESVNGEKVKDGYDASSIILEISV